MAKSVEDWLVQCRNTYQRELPKLQKTHPGKFVAINGDKIVEVNKLSILDKKYLKEGAPSIKIYYIPEDKLKESEDDLVLSTPLFS